jgi:RimJ/RimL family protein N-acetyltransferase
MVDDRPWMAHHFEMSQRLRVPTDRELTLRSPNLLLEPVLKSHARELYRLFGDSRLHEFVAFEMPTFARQKKRCEQWARRRSADGSKLWLNWVARENARELVVGHFQVVLKSDFSASVGYLVGHEFQGRGFATEAMRAIFVFLRETFDVRKISAVTDSENIASHRLAKRLGMAQSEVIKGADFFKGKSRDEFVFTLELK